jgi:DNA polymerase III gamma/tau subunit
MEQGLYTGKKVSDYIDLVDEDDVEDLREMTQARRVVNLMDQAKTIANLGLKFERALKAGGYPY